MAEITVRNLDDDVHDRLKALARKQGRSLEETVREILRNATLRQPASPKGLGTRLSERFAKYKLTDELSELPRQQLKSMNFEE